MNNNDSKDIYRQGDVLLRKVKRRPRCKMELVPKVDGKIVLAFGEATGHAHVIEDESRAILSRDESRAILSRDESNRIWLEIFSPTKLIHGDLNTLQNGDHDEIALGRGTYQVTRQREYAPRENTGVRDVED